MREVRREALGVGVEEAHELALEAPTARATSHRPCRAPARSAGSSSASCRRRAPARGRELGGAVRARRRRRPRSRRSRPARAARIERARRSRRPSRRTRARAGTPTRCARALGRDPLGAETRMVEGASSRGQSLGRRGVGIASTISSPWPTTARTSPGARCWTRAARTGGWCARRARGPGGRELVDAPAELHPDAARGARAARHRAALLPPGPGAARRLGGADDRHHRHRLGQVDVLQPADARRALPRRARARAVPVPDQGARAGPGARARALRADQARAPGDLRRRHAARGARGDPQAARTSC